MKEKKNLTAEQKFSLFEENKIHCARQRKTGMYKETKE